MKKGDKFYTIRFGEPELHVFHRYTDGMDYHPVGTIQSHYPDGNTLWTVSPKLPVYPFSERVFPYTYQGFLDCCQAAQDQLDRSKMRLLNDWKEEVVRDTRLEGESTRMEVTGKEYAVTSITPENKAA